MRYYCNHKEISAKLVIHLYYKRMSDRVIEVQPMMIQPKTDLTLLKEKLILNESLARTIAMRCLS